MGGFFGWFVVIVGVLAIFNAEKLPELRALLEEKFKSSVDVAKEGSKLAKNRIKQVKTEMENKKNAEEQKEAEDNTPEEIEESLKFMGSFINKNKKAPAAAQPAAAQPATAQPAAAQKVAAKAETKVPEAVKEDKPVDLENRY